MPTLPPAVYDGICRHIFEEMARAGWDGMTAAQRSAQYDAWMHDPEVGGRLTAFMTEARARVWLKDGPAKEYTRARAGIGRFATLVDSPETSYERIVGRALGENWVADPNSLDVKPLRVTASSSDETRVVAWGPARDLKHLAWAMLIAQSNGDARRWTLVLTDTFTSPLSSADKAAHQRVAERLGVDLVHLTLR